MNIKKFSGIVFDLDGTLINSGGHVLETFNYALAPTNIQLSLDDIERLRSRTREELFHDFGLTAEQLEVVKKRMKDFHNQSSHTVPLFDGIFELITSLAQQNYKMAVWTGRDTKTAKDLLTYHQLIDCFTIVLGNCTLSANKPSPEGILKVASHMGIAPEDLVMIGDHDHDIEAGIAVNATTVRVLWSSTPQKNLNADFEMATPHALHKLLTQYYKIC